MILAENDDKEEESSSSMNGENSDSESDSDEEESKYGKWSDRGLMDKYGKITAIGIEEEEDGFYIQRIRARCLLSHLLLFPLPGTAERRQAGRSGDQLDISIATREPTRWS